MSRLMITVVLAVCGLRICRAEETAEAEPSRREGAEFLQSMIKRMQQDKFFSSGEEYSDYRPTPLPSHHQVNSHQQYGPEAHAEVGDQHGPPLSKAELLALYQAAVTKGAGLDLSQLPALPLSGENHSENHPPVQNQFDVQHNGDELVAPADQGTLPGYYYYFYPIKSFMPNHTGDGSNHSAMDMNHMMMMMGDHDMGDMKETRIDPLFLAMAGFVSMATIVSFSILFLPKFGDNRSNSKSALKELPDEEDEMMSLTRVVGQAIQGQDCHERLACELGHAIRNMKLGQKPIRVLEAMLPPQLARQMSQVRKHMVSKDKCHQISCRKPDKSKPKPNGKKPPNKKTASR